MNSSVKTEGDLCLNLNLNCANPVEVVINIGTEAENENECIYDKKAETTILGSLVYVSLRSSSLNQPRIYVFYDSKIRIL